MESGQLGRPGHEALRDPIMECPSCQYVREEKDRVIPDWQCPSCGVAYAKFTAAAFRKARARLVSGTVTSSVELSCTI